MKVVGLVGSLRKQSYNLQLAHTIRERHQQLFSLEILDLRSLPHYDQDDEMNPVDAVKEFKQKVAESDAVMIFTPEFNWSIPSVLKNALDWGSRNEKVFVDKPVLVAGVSTGMLGTIRAQLHLRDILASAGIRARLFPPAGNEILVAGAQDKFDAATGRLSDETTLQFVDGVVQRFVEFVKK